MLSDDTVEVTRDWMLHIGAGRPMQAVTDALDKLAFGKFKESKDNPRTGNYQVEVNLIKNSSGSRSVSVLIYGNLMFTSPKYTRGELRRLLDSLRIPYQ